MNKIQEFTIESNQEIANDVYKMILLGDNSWIRNPGQFINITIDNRYLKRPISISDYYDNKIEIIYKVVGYGTNQLKNKTTNDKLEALVDLGNGFELVNEEKVILIGGGIGVPPLYKLCKELIKNNIKVDVILGFNSKDDVFYEQEFKSLNCDTYVSTVDGTYGVKGFVTDIIKNNNLNSYYYACGPINMLKAINKQLDTKGQLSFEAKMGCGFGACMGCSCETITSYKRICKEGPVLKSEELIWND